MTTLKPEIEEILKKFICPECKKEIDISKEIAELVEKIISNNSRIYSKDVEEVYKNYPSRCVIGGRALGKSIKNKNKIKALLKLHTIEYLVDLQEKYKSDCLKTNTYMKNYGTYLNQLPDPEQFEDITEKKVW